MRSGNLGEHSRLALGFALVLTLGLLSGCIGSPRPRNPNRERLDKGAEAERLDAALVRNRRRRRIYEPVDEVTINLPRNSWASHDRHVHKTLGRDYAQRIAPIYPWFPVETGAAAAKSDD